ncbi:hypothetical protein BO78DRAFT_417162 [Aspergillus sclerotiicarbonarius CBS 121057]|uniref:Uncharacterized protein n=1 Tax=Aspergillus sclerotiicarbonarius (strain CBS 121057 / IBT 28362) TaxID=1448318 RepID=A0A319ED46_ASPSB|nr:hypothetical protein BO78DRAFT_417162 [Aspergillus sclerotiicarbonarius CBS 121057]
MLSENRRFCSPLRHPSFSASSTPESLITSSRFFLLSSKRRAESRVPASIYAQTTRPTTTLTPNAGRAPARHPTYRSPLRRFRAMRATRQDPSWRKQDRIYDPRKRHTTSSPRSLDPTLPPRVRAPQTPITHIAYTNSLLGSATALSQPTARSSQPLSSRRTRVGSIKG